MHLTLFRECERGEHQKCPEESVDFTKCQVCSCPCHMRPMTNGERQDADEILAGKFKEPGTVQVPRWVAAEAREALAHYAKYHGSQSARAALKELESLWCCL